MQSDITNAICKYVGINAQLTQVFARRKLHLWRTKLKGALVITMLGISSFVSLILGANLLR
jgi:hypothetical protein